MSDPKKTSWPPCVPSPARGAGPPGSSPHAPGAATIKQAADRQGYEYLLRALKNLRLACRYIDDDDELVLALQCAQRMAARIASERGIEVLS